jgi:hypothetical protein
MTSEKFTIYVHNEGHLLAGKVSKIDTQRAYDGIPYAIERTVHVWDSGTMAELVKVARDVLATVKGDRTDRGISQRRTARSVLEFFGVKYEPE